MAPHDELPLAGDPGSEHSGAALRPGRRGARNGRSNDEQGGIGGRFSSGVYGWLAAELFAGCLVFGWWLVHLSTHPGTGRPAAPAVNDLGWGLLVSLVVIWGGVLLHAAARASHRSDNERARHLVAIVVCCATIGIGLQLIIIGRGWLTRPHLVDLSAFLDVPARSVGGMNDSSPPVIGDPDEGQKLFVMSCASCHGVTGNGVANAAPSLRGSVFLTSASDAEVMNLIRQGRTPQDPRNKTGKVMPARGGNPFLKDPEIAHLAAFLRTLPGLSTGSANGLASEGVAGGATLSEWVVPAPPRPGGRFELRELSRFAPDDDPVQWRENEAYQSVLAGLISLSSAIFGAHLLFTCTLMIAWLAQRRVDRADSSTWGIAELRRIWFAGGGGWLVFFLAFYVYGH